MKIISRKEAKKLGLTRFYTGKPCVHGHLSDRSVCDGGCVECRRIRERKKYNRDIDKYREKSRLNAQKMRNKNPDLCRDRNNKWNKLNREKTREMRRRFVKENPERAREIDAKHRDKNRERRRQSVRDCYKKNPKLWAYHSKKRKIDKLKRTPKWANIEEIKKIYKNCPKDYHVDHIYPLRGKLVSGLHVENNLQYLPAIDNLKKKNKMPEISNG